jgi:CRISPR-associated endonuclease Csn1
MENQFRYSSLKIIEDFVKRNFHNNKSKMKKLLMEEPPEGFIERQLNDSRYISKVVKNLLSNILRQDNEQEAISKNLITVTGGITTQMKLDWGLENVWNEIIAPRYVRLNEMTQSNAFGSVNPSTNKFLPQVPLEHQKGYNRKRIDHRHHALDALVIACITREHVNYLNSINSERKNYSLVSRLRRTDNVTINGNPVSVAKEFYKPWETFTQDARKNLEKIIISFKQNLRIISKTNNYYQSWQKDEHSKYTKKHLKQTKGENIAIRKPIHKDTVAGLVKLKFRKWVSLPAALDNWEMITE